MFSASVVARLVLIFVLFAGWFVDLTGAPLIPSGPPVEAPDPVPLYTGCGGVNVPPVNDADEQAVVELVNAARQAEGQPPLKRTRELDFAARYHSTDMFQDGYFDHNTYDQGSNDPVCLWNSRVSTFFPDANYLSENIAIGYPDPEAVFTGWMNSPGHRANILSGEVREIGSGYAAGGADGPYWTLDFGRRPEVFPLVINLDVAQTESRLVAVYLYNYHSEVPWLDMRLKDDLSDWSSWQPYQAVFQYTFTPGNGTRKLQAEMRNAVATAAAEDVIVLQEPEPWLGNLPEALSFTYIITSEAFLPPSAILQPANTGGGGAIAWSLSAAGDWFEATPLTGLTGETITIVPSQPDPMLPGLITGTLTVTATDPPGVGGSPHTIHLSLYVVEEDFRVYLPKIFR